MKRTAILALAALASLALAACGPDDQPSLSATQASANASLPASAVEPLVLAAPLAAPSDDQSASSPIAAAQASLAADAQQVAPVLHSAPAGLSNGSE